MKAYEAAVDLFAARDVDTVFTLLSEEIIEFVSEMEDNWGEHFRVVHCRHEQGAAAMADGFSRAGDGIGVCIVGRGPAIAQTGTSLVTASNNGSRVLYVVPETRRTTAHDGKGFEQTTYLETMVGDVASVRTPERVVPALSEAIYRLRAGQGPIAVQVPTDVLEADVPDDSVDALGEPPRAPQDARIQPEPSAVEAAVDCYLDSDATKAPVVLAGRGAVASGAKEAIEALAERLGAYLVTSARAMGYFADHPFGLGFAGDLGSDLANEYVMEADYVLGIGAGLNHHTVDSGHLLAEGAKVVHVDTDPGRIGRFTEVDVGIVGDARVTAEALTAELDELGIERADEFWTEKVRRRVEEHDQFTDRTFEEVPGTVDPRDLVRALEEVLPEDRFLVSDVGHFGNWVFDGLTLGPTDRFLWTVDFLSLGQALPMSVGAAMAEEERTTITVCGDGGLMMVLQELETAARNDVPLVVVVFNDEALGAEYHMAKIRGYSGESGRMTAPDFADVAADLGATGHTIRSVEDVEALAGELDGDLPGPVVLDCKVNPEVLHQSMGNLSIE